VTSVMVDTSEPPSDSAQRVRSPWHQGPAAPANAHHIRRDNNTRCTVCSAYTRREVSIVIRGGCDCTTHHAPDLHLHW
jgi:hypothetical protein